jgi:hypothetical protein
MFDGRSNMLRLFGTDSSHTFLNSKCPWIIVSILNILATTGYNITHCKMSSSPRRMCPSLTQLLADPEHAVGSRLICGLQKTYCTKHTHLHVTGSLSPHCAFDLRRISRALILCHYEYDDTAQFCTRSDKIWRNLILVEVHRSEMHDHLQCCYQLCIREFYFSGAYVCREELKSGLTLDNPHTFNLRYL